MKETKLHVLDEAGKRVWRGRCASEPAAIAAAIRRYAPADDAQGLAHLVRAGWYREVRVKGRGAMLTKAADWRTQSFAQHLVVP